MADKIKLLVAILLIAAGITGFYYYAEEAVLLYRVLALLGILIVSFIVMLQTQMGLNTWNFGRSAVIEVRKAVWPTRQETIQATLMVMVMVIIMGIILWLFDMLLLSAVQMLTGKGS